MPHTHPDFDGTLQFQANYKILEGPRQVASAVHRSRSFDLFCRSRSLFTSGKTINTINHALYEMCMRKIP